MPIFHNLAGTMDSQFSIGKGTNRIDIRTNSGTAQWRNYGGSWNNFGSGSGGGVDEGSSFPSTPSEATLFYRNDLDALFLYSVTESIWLDVSGLLTGSGRIDEGNAFPSSPGEPILFYRNDLDALFLYSVTESVWLDISGILAGDYLITTESKSANFGAEKNKRYLVDTTGGQVSVTLPSSPDGGDTFWILDAASNFATTTCRLLYGSSKILSTSGNYLLNDDDGLSTVTYVDATYGWSVVTSIPTGAFE